MTKELRPRHLITLVTICTLTATACSDRTPTASPDQGLPPDATVADAAPLPDKQLPDAAPPDQAAPLCKPCTDGSCCTSSETYCFGDPSKGIVCFCYGQWSCSKDLKSCEHPILKPEQTLPWTCSWTASKYSCTTKGSAAPPPGIPSHWSCAYETGSGSWRCTTAYPPNPCNKAEGAGPWTCTVDAAKGQLLCTSAGIKPPPPCASGTWSCSKESSGLEYCKRTDKSGLPAAGSGWICHSWINAGVATWICQGQASANPQGGGWSCKVVSGGYRCSRPHDACDRPSKAGVAWSCALGSAFGGTRCEGVPAGGCVPGQRQWCDGLVYSGWGQVECDGSGAWKTKTVNGKVVLACQESLAGSKVPPTACACYHFFFNPDCCQRADCVVPKGSSSQSCGMSAGGLCDYCNPMKPECKKTGAKCIVTNSSETFCGEECATTPCAGGYTCMTIKLKVGTTKQCVPSDFSCYY